jgi:hypothetical protein
VLYHANGTNAGYDGLNRLTDMRRGTLSDANSDGVYDTVSTLNTLTGSQRNWSLDAVGNWSSSQSDGATTNRTHNRQNQVTAVGANTLTFDNNGNTTSDDHGNVLTYDAWNRLYDACGAAGHESRYYDALGREVRIDYHDAVNTFGDIYYSSDWQDIEEHNIYCVSAIRSLRHMPLSSRIIHGFGRCMATLPRSRSTSRPRFTKTISMPALRWSGRSSSLQKVIPSPVASFKERGDNRWRWISHRTFPCC